MFRSRVGVAYFNLKRDTYPKSREHGHVGPSQKVYGYAQLPKYMNGATS